jgi:hypothetical protein
MKFIFSKCPKMTLPRCNSYFKNKEEATTWQKRSTTGKKGSR